MIYFWPWLLKCEENKWGFQGKGHKKPFCVRGVCCRSYEQRVCSNMHLLSLAYQVGYKDCRYPSLAPAIIAQRLCWFTLGRISSVNLTKKPHWIIKPLKNPFFFGGGGEVLEVIWALLLVASAVWILSWLDACFGSWIFFFSFPWGMWVCKWDQYCIKPKLLSAQSYSRFVWDNFRDVGLLRWSGYRNCWQPWENLVSQQRVRTGSAPCLDQAELEATNREWVDGRGPNEAEGETISAKR